MISHGICPLEHHPPESHGVSHLVIVSHGNYLGETTWGRIQKNLFSQGIEENDRTYLKSTLV